jgi:hypothetical protein
MKKIYAKLYGGFGSRLPGLVSSIFVSKISNRNLHLYWDEVDLAPYETLFSYPNFKFITKQEYNVASMGYCEPTIFISHPANFLSQYLLDLNITLCWHAQCWFPIIDQQRKKAFDYLRSFVPTEDVLKLIPEIPSNCVGVWIRSQLTYADHPIKDFLDKMHEFDESIQFYISSDTEESLKECLKHFGNRCLYVHNKYYAKLRSQDLTNPIYCQSYLAELYALSKCSTILDSDYSCFGRLASVIGNTKRVAIGGKIETGEKK